MNMFQPTQAKTPNEYIDLIEEPRKKEIQQLHELIIKTVPALKPYIISGMIGYGTYHYKSVSGREGDWCILALASRKNYISVYICVTKGDQYLAELYKDQLPKTSIGKSCIRFKSVDDVDLKVLANLFREAEDLMRK